MFATLTEAMIATYDALYLEKINSMSCSDFWDTVTKKAISYEECLYFATKYFDGTLKGMKHYPVPFDDTASAETLIELNKAGAFTYSGQPSIPEEQMRSYLVFKMVFDDKPKVITFLDRLHLKGLNVWACIVQYEKAIEECVPDCKHEPDMFCKVSFPRYASCTTGQRIALFKSDDYSIADYSVTNTYANFFANDDDARKQCEVTKPGTYCWPIFSEDDDPMIDYIDFPFEYVMDIAVFSQQWDDLQADEVVLETMREME